MKTKGVVANLLLAFGLAWSMIFIVRLLLGLSLENSLVQIPIAFTPAIAAVIVRRWITRDGFGTRDSRSTSEVVGPTIWRPGSFR